MLQKLLSLLLVFSMILTSFFVICPSDTVSMITPKDGDPNKYAAGGFIPGTLRGPQTVTNVGDVNGDGYDDFIIGLSEYFNSTFPSFQGNVFLFFGKASGWSINTSFTTADASWYGEFAGDELGAWVAAAGDVNGDGYDDIIVGHHSCGWTGKAYLIFGKATGWKASSNISTADVVFIGKSDYPTTGESVAGIGDVNGDGYDDVAIGSINHGGKSGGKGAVYLIFGRKTNWNSPINVTTKANASFIGENTNDMTDYVIGKGDVNGDKLDDFLISSIYYVDQKQKGKVYLILGKKKGWNTGVSLANANASYEGLKDGDYAGSEANIIGDINGDGLDDFSVRSAANVYLFFGQTNGWKTDQLVTAANASFKDVFGAGRAGDLDGDGIEDFTVGDSGHLYVFLGNKTGWAQNMTTGNAVSYYQRCNQGFNGGDFNRDGFSDLLIGCGTSTILYNVVYLVFPEVNDPPISINTVKAYSGSDYLKEINTAGMDQQVFIEIAGTDGNSSKVDMTIVNITSNRTSPVGFFLKLKETGKNTGHYRGNFTLAGRSHDSYRWLGTAPGETVKITSVVDPTKYKTLIVGYITLWSNLTQQTIQEDSPFGVHFWAENGKAKSWDLKTNATWLTWDSIGHNLSGTPSNKDVGSYYVKLNISDFYGFNSSLKFNLTVKNTPPIITTTNVLIAAQDKSYNVDYNCTDEGSGTVQYHLATNASWLSIVASGGFLNGKPVNKDVGSYWVNVSVDDGNGGWDSTNFTLSVVDVNDPPKISTKDQNRAYEDQLYHVKYCATDPDIYDTDLKWSIVTNAKWLTVDNATADLNGTPANKDVGTYHVNVTVTDSKGAHDSHAFDLYVMNTNDPPVWSQIQGDTTILEGAPLQFTIKATDVDVGSRIFYIVKSEPATDIKVDTWTGNVSWANTLVGHYFINLSASDGYVTIYYKFNLTVLKAEGTPKAYLVSPQNMATLTVQNPTFSWKLVQEGNGTLWSELYIGKNLIDVQASVPNTHLGVNLTTDHFTPTSPLDKGTTYYWTVIPHSEKLPGLCINGTWSFNISGTAVFDNPPAFVTTPNRTASVGTEWTYEPKVQDPDAKDTLSIKLIAGPLGMTYISGILRWTPSQAQIGNFLVKLEVSDGKLQTYQEFTLTVKKTVPVNRAPQFGQNSDINVKEGETVSYQLKASDPDGDALSFLLVYGPADLTVSSTGLIVWTTKVGDAGTYNVSVSVSDGSLSDKITIKITVTKEQKGRGSNGLGILIPLAILGIVIAIIAVIGILLWKKRARPVPVTEAVPQIQPYQVEEVSEIEPDEKG